MDSFSPVWTLPSVVFVMVVVVNVVVVTVVAAECACCCCSCEVVVVVTEEGESLGTTIKDPSMGTVSSW